MNFFLFIAFLIAPLMICASANNIDLSEQEQAIIDLSSQIEEKNTQLKTIHDQTKALFSKYQKLYAQATQCKNFQYVDRKMHRSLGYVEKNLELIKEEIDKCQQKAGVEKKSITISQPSEQSNDEKIAMLDRLNYRLGKRLAKEKSAAMRSLDNQSPLFLLEQANRTLNQFIEEQQKIAARAWQLNNIYPLHYPSRKQPSHTKQHYEDRIQAISNLLHNPSLKKIILPHFEKIESYLGIKKETFFYDEEKFSYHSLFDFGSLLCAAEILLHINLDTNFIKNGVLDLSSFKQMIARAVKQSTMPINHPSKQENLDLFCTKNNPIVDKIAPPNIFCKRDYVPLLPIKQSCNRGPNWLICTYIRIFFDASTSGDLASVYALPSGLGNKRPLYRQKSFLQSKNLYSDSLYCYAACKKFAIKNNIFWSRPYRTVAIKKPLLNMQTDLANLD